MKAPLEQLESNTPMSASEGGVYVLVGAALVGFGVLIGYTRASLNNVKDLKAELRNTSSSQRRNPDSNRPRNPQKTNPGDPKP